MQWQMIIPDAHDALLSWSATTPTTDKFCGQVSDVVLDACITGDESSHVACETCCKTDMVMIFASTVNYKQVIWDAIKDIGYDEPTKGFELQDAQRHCGHWGAEPDILQSVDAVKVEDIGAGDQGIMFGYATNETETIMRLIHMLATSLGSKLLRCARTAPATGFAPMERRKSRVSTSWSMESQSPQCVHTIVISTQHSEDVTNEKISANLMEHVIKPVDRP
jgi:S-adenosylmethionine synthetase